MTHPTPALAIKLTAVGLAALLGVACSSPPAPTESAREYSTSRAIKPAPPAPPAAARDARSTVSVECPPEFSGTCYPVWFGTNRKPVDPDDPAKGFSGSFDNTMHFGKRVVFIPDSHRPGELGSPLWKRLLTGVDDRIKLAGGTELSEAAFQREIRGFLDRLDPADQNILVFIHGFNTSFDDAVRRSAQLGFDLKVPGITTFYSWPSQGKLSGYFTDVAAIEASEEHIASFLVKVAGLAENGKVHIIAHSMGNRGLLRAMYRATAQAAVQAGVRFGQIFLAAPDVDVNLFRQLAAIYPKVSERTTLYVADEDKALAAMEWIAQDRKAGSAPPLLILPGIDTIRVKGAGLFQLGHSYVAEEPDVIRDIRALLYWREPPAKRRLRNHWPVPDQSAQSQGAWIIGE